MARHLERSAMKAEDVVPRIAAFAGLTVAGLMIPGGEPRQARGQAGVEKALGGFFYEDGGIASRSPVQALAMLELLVTARSLFSSSRFFPAPWAGPAACRLVPAVQRWTRGEGGVEGWPGGGSRERGGVMGRGA